MSMQDAIKNAAAAATKVVAGVSPDQLGDPTPCSDYDVRALGNHMTGFLPYSANAARKGPDMEDEAPDLTAGDWAGTYAHLADDLVASWAEAARWRARQNSAAARYLQKTPPAPLSWN